MSSDPSTFPELVSSPERRRSPRRSAKLRALLALGPQIHRVDLLDFSHRGLKATFVGTPPPAETLEQWLGKSAQLSTTSALSGFALPAFSIRVARVGKNEVGLEADSEPLWAAIMEASSSGVPYACIGALPADGGAQGTARIGHVISAM